MLISNVVALSNSVKIIKDTANDVAIISGRFLSLTFPVTEPPIIIGKSGNTHGAKTVSMPAINAPKNKNMVYLILSARPGALGDAA
jgi:hypothetical protein